MFRTDAHFLIGNQHTRQGMPCQDYALASTVGNSAYAIVSDGCSSGGSTDVGARLVALTTSKLIQEALQTDDFSPKSLPEMLAARDIQLQQVKNELGLTTNDMLASCLHAIATPWGSYVHVHGDGVVILTFEDGKQVHAFDWDNTPFYPAYNWARKDGFMSHHSEQGSSLKQTLYTFEGDSTTPSTELEYQYQIEEGIAGITLGIPNQPHANFGKLKQIALFSDGLEQVDQMDALTAYNTFNTFKGTGVFVRRWLAKHVRDSQKFGLGPQDDIACAVIQFEEESS